MSPDNVPWLVHVTTTGGNSEDGNLHYTDTHVFGSRDEALAAVRKVLPDATPEVSAGGDWIDFTDNWDNWVIARKADDGPLALKVTPEEFDEEQGETQ